MPERTFWPYKTAMCQDIPAADQPAWPLSREMLLAWHLRDDIRAGRSLDDPEARLDFTLWWMSWARIEFPAAAQTPGPEELALAREIVIPASEAGDVPITRLMAFTKRLREKDAAGHSLSGAPGRRAFATWFYVCAVPELSLFDLLSDRERAWLLEPVTPPIAPIGLPLPRLVRLTWESRADVRDAFDLFAPDGPFALLAWYCFHGATEMRHQGYLSWLPRQALGADIPGRPGLSVLGLLAWQADEEARSHINPATPEGVARLSAWLAETGVADKLAASLAAPPPERPRPPAASRPRHAFGVNIIGYARGELGIGEDSRMCALALSAAEVPFSVVNIPLPEQGGPRQQDDYLDACLAKDTPYPVNIFCLTGLDTIRLWLERGESLFGGRINIGYWPWELPAWPDGLAGAYTCMDELWLSSAYTRDAFAKTSPVPVRLMPMAVSVDRITPRPRAFFGLPEDRFLFLFTFDCNSFLARKNPLAVIRAFRRAFAANDAPVDLVLKTMNARADDPKWRALADAAQGDTRIRFLDGTMDRGDVLGLFAACDAYVSPHRAEGFGRTLAEAMLLGKPVVATGYSGNTDFLTPVTGFPVPYRFAPIGPEDYPFGEGLLWADPDETALARIMGRIVREPGLAAARAAAGRNAVERRHHPRVVGDTYRQRLLTLCRR